MPSERGVLLRRAIVTALLAGGVGAGAATVAVAATHSSTPSASTSTTATTPSTAPSAKPTHNCPNMGSHAHGSSSTSGLPAGPGQ
jgi:hypothetical protein